MSPSKWKSFCFNLKVFITCWHQTITWANVHFSLVKFWGIHMRAISQSGQATSQYNKFQYYSFLKDCHISQGLMS